MDLNVSILDIINNQDSKTQELVRFANKIENLSGRIKGYRINLKTTENARRAERMETLLTMFLERLDNLGLLTQFENEEEKKNELLNKLMPKDQKMSTKVADVRKNIRDIVERARRGEEIVGDGFYIILMLRGYANKLAHAEDNREKTFTRNATTSDFENQVEAEAEKIAEDIKTAALTKYGSFSAFPNRAQSIKESELTKLISELMNNFGISNYVPKKTKVALGRKIYELIEQGKIAEAKEKIKEEAKKAVDMKMFSEDESFMKMGLIDIYEGTIHDPNFNDFLSVNGVKDVVTFKSLVDLLVEYEKEKKKNPSIQKPIIEPSLQETFDKLCGYYDQMVTSGIAAKFNLDEILPEMALEIGIEKKAFDVKQISTRIALEEKKEMEIGGSWNRFLTSVEQNPATSKAEGTINIYQEGFLNVFGIHYLPGDTEITSFGNFRKVGIKETRDEIKRAYNKGVTLYAFNVPVKLTKKQQAHLEKIANVILYIEEMDKKDIERKKAGQKGPDNLRTPAQFKKENPDEYEKLNIDNGKEIINLYDVLFDLKKKQNGLFQGIKYQAILGSGVQNYVNYYKRNEDDPLKLRSHRPLGEPKYAPWSELRKMYKTAIARVGDMNIIDKEFGSKFKGENKDR